MSLNLPTFYKRASSAVVFIIIMLTGLLSNIWVFSLMATAIQVLCLEEYFNLMKKIEPDMVLPRKYTLIIQIIGVISLWISTLLVYPSFYTNYSLSWSPILFFPALVLILSLLPDKHYWKAGMYALAGLLYIVLPMLLFVQIRVVCVLIPLAIILMIWTSDTMAYLVGSLIGKTPFSPISPHKTWEGTIGGVVLTIIVGAIWGHLSKSFSFYQNYKMIDWIMLSVIVSVSGPIGDLVKSRLKRLADVKDSGKLMPGHGGALDRFDSLLIAIPFAYSYIWFFMPKFNQPVTIFLWLFQ